MRYYEIMRYAFKITNESTNKTIRKEVFNDLDSNMSQERRSDMFNKQHAFIKLLRNEMQEGRILADIAEYKNNIMVIVASPNNINEYIIIIFDKHITGERYEVKMDKELNKIYIEEGGIINE